MSVIDAKTISDIVDTIPKYSSALVDFVMRELVEVGIVASPSKILPTVVV